MKIGMKNIIVTGAASGIGKELTKYLLLEGANVAAVDISVKNLKKLEEELNTKKLKAYVVDMSNNESIEKFKENYKKDYTNADIIINSAGIIQPFVDVGELSDEIITKVMNVNFFGPVNLIKSFMGDLTSDGKERYIVNISSIVGFFPFPGQTIYGASKAALKIFTEGLYAELKKTNVKVMLVFPATLNTNIATDSSIEMDEFKNASNYKLLDASVAARQIIKGIKNNKFRLYLGKNVRFLRFLFKINPERAIKYMNKKLKSK